MRRRRNTNEPIPGRITAVYREGKWLRNNPSSKRKALRAKYRKKHGNDWWQDDKIKARFKKELKAPKRRKK
jgi:hypothetical protein